MSYIQKFRLLPVYLYWGMEGECAGKSAGCGLAATLCRAEPSNRQIRLYREICDKEILQ